MQRADFPLVSGAIHTHSRTDGIAVWGFCILDLLSRGLNWRPADDPLTIHWWSADDSLTTRWRPTDDPLMICCQLAADSLTTRRRPIDDPLTTRRRPTDSPLTTRWWSTDDPLSHNRPRSYKQKRYVKSKHKLWVLQDHFVESASRQTEFLAELFCWTLQTDSKCRHSSVTDVRTAAIKRTGNRCGSVGVRARERVNCVKVVGLWASQSSQRRTKWGASNTSASWWVAVALSSRPRHEWSMSALDLIKKSQSN